VRVVAGWFGGKVGGWGLLLGLLVWGGCAPQSGVLQTSALYEEGMSQFLAGRYGQAANRLGRAATESADGQLRARASLLEGRSCLALGQFHQAEAAFRRGLTVGFLPKEVQAGLEFGLADSLYGQERYREAEERYQHVLRYSSDFIMADEAAFKMAVACQRAGLWEEARRQFAFVAGRFPRSPRAEAARRYQQAGFQGFTVQCGAFSSADAAQRLAASLRQKGFSPRLAAATGPAGGSLTAVQVGSFRTWADAVRLRTQLQRAGFEARILP
jgi:TolA-binding protein